MNHLTWVKLVGPLKWVAGVGILALIAGWAAFKNNPTGFLQFTDGQKCPSIAHSFSTIYLAVLGVAVVICLTVGIVCLIARELHIFKHFHESIRGLAVSCAFAGLGFALIAALYSPLMTMMPLTPSEPCKVKSLPNG
jgi:hypothetical protein